MIDVATIPSDLTVLEESPVQVGTTPVEWQLAHFAPIGLENMTRVKLLNRVDTKYLMHVDELETILGSLRNKYCVLDIAGTRAHRYRTLYFDSPDFGLYMQHHNGKRPRYKVRSREYVDTQLTFLEVKRKRCQRTIKDREQTQNLVATLNEPVGDFIREHFPFDVSILEPKLWVVFRRITLVSVRRPERLTIDIDLQFHWGTHSVTFPEIVVVEVKQPHFSQASDIVQQMRVHGVRSMSFSKYCAGVELVHGVKGNRFSPRLREARRLMQRRQHDERVH
jgi:hypothetical protein